MACARCDFYLPKVSTHAQLLEAKGHLQRMLTTIPLTEPERAAVEKRGREARQLDGRPASLRSDHDPRSARSRWADLSVHLRRYTQLSVSKERGLAPIVVNYNLT
jgi:hypothetical protein